MADVYLYPSNATEQDCLTGVGYGAITALAAPVTEELLIPGQTGLFMATVTISVKDPLAGYFKADAILGLSTPRGRDYFRICLADKTIRDITAKAWQISYDLANGLIANRAWEGYALAAVWQNILEAGGDTSFRGVSDIVDTAGVRIVRRNVIEAIVGQQDNSVVNRWGGELDRHGWEIDMLARLGQHRGVAIRYGQNLTGLNDVVDTSETYHAVLPTYLIGENTPVVMSVIKCPGYATVERPKTVAIHFGDIRVGEDEGYYPDKTAAEQAVADRVDAMWLQGAHKPRASSQIEFVDLRRIPEYQDLAFLEDISLGDTIRAVWEGHLDIEQRVIRYEWDACRDRYISIELGSPGLNITVLTNRLETIFGAEIERHVAAATSQMVASTVRLNQVYAGAMGYHETTMTNAETGARMLYIHDQPELADSTFIATVPEPGTYLWTDQGWNDGSPVWNYGVSQDGNAVLRYLSIVGMDAVWIRLSDGTDLETALDEIETTPGPPGADGKDGADGAAGRSVTGVTTYWLASASSSGVTRATSGWTTANQSTSDLKPYLWTYEKIDWSVDPTPSYLEPHIVGTHGSTGAAGQSAYEAAVEDGFYSGSEEEFAYDLSWASAIEGLAEHFEETGSFTRLDAGFAAFVKRVTGSDVPEGMDFSATVIDGGKIQTQSVTANQLNVTSLSAISADLGAITSGSITITGSGAKLKISTSDPLRLEDDSGNFVGGLITVGGQLALAASRLMEGSSSPVYAKIGSITSNYITYDGIALYKSDNTLASFMGEYNGTMYIRHGLGGTGGIKTKGSSNNTILVELQTGSYTLSLGGTGISGIGIAAFTNSNARHGIGVNDTGPYYWKNGGSNVYF